MMVRDLFFFQLSYTDGRGKKADDVGAPGDSQETTRQAWEGYVPLAQLYLLGPRDLRWQ